MKITIDGIHTVLHTIDCEDAQNIIQLRNQPQINKHLSSSREISLIEQKQWLFDNAQKKDGIYLKIISKKDNCFCGTISIYNVDIERNAEFGRYICTRSLQAIEAELLIVRFAFDVMKLNNLYCRTAALNTKVWRQHYEYGFVDNGEELFEEKNIILKRQNLTQSYYSNFDYSNFDNLLNKIKYKTIC